MKRMKTKRFLSLLLALAMSLSLAAPAFANEVANISDSGIVPQVKLYDPQEIGCRGSFRSVEFTSIPGSGQHIKVWYANRSDYKAYVMLFIEGQYEPVAMKEIAPNTHKDVAFWYDIPDTEPVTFHIRIQAEISGPISGYMSVAQQTVKT